MKKNYKQRNWLFKLKTIFTFSFILIVSLASAQLNGTYTIDSSAITSGTNYQSFTDFADSITKHGVSGSVTVNVASNSGPYYQWVEFGDISGASSTNTITINGNGNTVSHAGSNSRTPVFTFKSTDHFTLDNLIIENTGTDYGRCVQIRDVSTYVTVSNCQLNMPNMRSIFSRNCYVLLGNGSKDDSEDPTYTFENVDQGTFTVCLATKKGECWNDACEDITINLAGIENLTQNDDMINVYPNPTTGKFNVTVENAGEVVVKVGDILGNVLDVNVTDNLNGTYSVDLSVVADGVYFVQVENGDYFATKRITVSK